MARPFRWFIVLAGMRTGSNLLESQLNLASGVTCHGEAFNPRFAGHEGEGELLGIRLVERDEDPDRLLRRILDRPGLNGFRFFHDHDPRVLERALADPGCAKIVLTRAPLDSFLSLGIARATGQWRLGRSRDRREARVPLDPAGFADFVRAQAEFQSGIRASLARSGQTAFHIDYDDLGDPAAVNGLLAFLGVPPLAELGTGTMRQNPTDPSERAVDPASLAAAVGAVDWAALSAVPVTEPRRNPGVPAFVASRAAPVLYMPVPPLSEDWILPWLEDPGGITGGGEPAGTDRDFSQRSLRAWMQARPGHRAFTIVRHPLPRAYAAFLRTLATSPPDVIDTLRENYRVHLPAAPSGAGPGPMPGPMPNPGPDECRAAFLAFLRFLRINLDGRSRLRTQPHWASQSSHLAAMATFRAPDAILRAESLSGDLA